MIQISTIHSHYKMQIIRLLHEDSVKRIRKKLLNLLSNDHLFSSKYKSSILPPTFVCPILPTKSTKTFNHPRKKRKINIKTVRR